MDRTLKFRVLLEEESIESDVVDVEEVDEDGLRNVRTLCQNEPAILFDLYSLARRTGVKVIVKR